MLSTNSLIFSGVGFVNLDTIKDTIKLIIIPIVPIPQVIFQTNNLEVNPGPPSCGLK